MQSRIRGSVMQVLDVQLNPGESVYTETGGMAWMSNNMQMSTNLEGGLGAGLGRMFSGESLFFTHYTPEGGPGIVTFCMETPGQIVEYNVSNGQSVICQRDAFMVATEGVEVKAEFTKKLGAGFFGGEGFFLQRISGTGKAWLELPGEITMMELQAGEQLKIDPGYLAAFEPTVQYDIRLVKGVKNIFLGGEGLFLAHVQGPGKVWLQSMPLSNFVQKIARYLPKK